MFVRKSKKSLSEYSTGELVMFRFRKNKLAMFGVVLLSIIVITILLAPLISSYDAVVEMNMADRFQSPNAKYLFGTDEFGRDLFARILYGGRISMFASLAVIGIAFVIGAIMGGAAGYLGGRVDTILMRAVDVLMAVPSVLLAMAIITALGNGVWKLIIALAVSQVARFARTVRASVLTLRNVEYVEAARTTGTGNLVIMLKYILPNAISPALVAFTFGIPSAILTESALSFLGLGIQIPEASWGNMLNAAQSVAIISTKPWLWIPAGMCIFITLISVNLFGDGLRDALDPKTKIG